MSVTQLKSAEPSTILVDQLSGIAPVPISNPELTTRF
jgi:hypothetical protein